MTLLHIHRDLLELADNAAKGNSLPAPTEIEPAVLAMIGLGLLSVNDNVLAITAAG